MKLQPNAVLATTSLWALSSLLGACMPPATAESPEARESAEAKEPPPSDAAARSDESSAPRASDSSPRSDEGSRVEENAPAKAARKGTPMPVFPGLKFGMSLEQIARLNDQDLDAEFRSRFLAASPSQSLQVEEELRDRKGVFRRSRIEFLDTPTGIDQSALKGEYSYANQESLARMPARTREDGKEVPARNFFFFDDKLWKVYEEYKLGPSSNLGGDFDAAVKKLAKVFGGAPQRVSADYQKGQSFDEAVWRDGEKIIRAIDRGDTLGIAFVDKSVQENLPKLRVHKLVDQHELDKDVKAATANPPTQVSGPPVGADKKDAGKPGAGKKK